jgi:hypothetical protein
MSEWPAAARWVRLSTRTTAVGGMLFYASSIRKSLEENLLANDVPDNWNSGFMEVLTPPGLLHFPTRRT